jgi:hypothetical protein
MLFSQPSSICGVTFEDTAALYLTAPSLQFHIHIQTQTSFSFSYQGSACCPGSEKFFSPSYSYSYFLFLAPIELSVRFFPLTFTFIPCQKTMGAFGLEVTSG